MEVRFRSRTGCSQRTPGGYLRVQNPAAPMDEGIDPGGQEAPAQAVEMLRAAEGQARSHISPDGQLLLRAAGAPVGSAPVVNYI